MSSIGFDFDKHIATFGPESEFMRNKQRHLALIEESKQSIQEYYEEPSDFEISQRECNESSDANQERHKTSHEEEKRVDVESQ